MRRESPSDPTGPEVARDRRAPRKAGTNYGLIALNGALLLVLAAVTLAPNADAQLRRRGAYAMVAGGVGGSDADAVWIVDTTNQELIALTYEPNQKELIGIGYRSLAKDAGVMTRTPSR